MFKVYRSNNSAFVLTPQIEKSCQGLITFEHLQSTVDIPRFKHIPLFTILPMNLILTITIVLAVFQFQQVLTTPLLPSSTKIQLSCQRPRNGKDCIKVQHPTLHLWLWLLSLLQKPKDNSTHPHKASSAGSD